MMRNEHLKNLQDMIVTEQVSGSHDNGNDDGNDVEEAGTLFGEVFNMRIMSTIFTYQYRR